MKLIEIGGFEMELTAAFIAVLMFFSIAVGGIWFLSRPRAKKKIGNRRYYVRWNR